MYKHFLTIAVMLTAALSLSAQTLSEQSSVSLMTCTPGYPLYLHFGHSAIRVQDEACLFPDSTVGPIDWTFNYGLFSFDTDHFYTKFVKGETDYMLGLERTDYFISGSNANGREVYEQVLRLSREERQLIVDALVENYQPENRVYRYNFVFDNCATRPMRLIEKALPDFRVSTDTLADTWRDQISYYAGRWSWGRFGINLVFGRQADERMTVAESLFLPENLMNYMQQTPLVGESRIGTFVPRDGRFLTSPELITVLLALLIVGITVVDIRRKRQSAWLDAILSLVWLVLGCIMTFLMFFSTHPFVGENANWLIISPLWIIPFVLCLWKNGREKLLFIAPGILLFAVVGFVFALFSGQTIHLLLLLPLLQACRLVVLKNAFAGRICTGHAGKKTATIVALMLTAGALNAAPKLTVIAVVDGMDADAMEELRPFWAPGGLRTIDTEASLTRISFPHLVYGGDETTATILSGETPFFHNYQADGYFYRQDRVVRSTLTDKNQRGINTKETLSMAAFPCTTIADRHRLREGSKAKIYAVGINPSTTVLLAGHAANACCWLEQNGWGATAYYSEGLPSAADKMNVKGGFSEAVSRSWSNQMDLAAYIRPSQEEKKKNGFNYQTTKVLHNTPEANGLVVSLALDIQNAEKLGTRGQNDLLLLNLTVVSPHASSAQIESAEQEEMYIGLNREMGRLMDELQKRVGKDNLQIVLIGKPRYGYSIKQLQAVGLPVARFNIDRAAALASTYLMALYGHERWIDGGFGNSIYLNKTLIQQKNLSIETIRRQVADFLMEMEGVQAAYTIDEVMRLPNSGEMEKLRNSTCRRSGDVVVMLTEGTILMLNDKVEMDQVIAREPEAPLYIWSGNGSKPANQPAHLSATAVYQWLNNL